MIEVSIKMVDGTRYDFITDKDNLDFNENGYALIEGDNKNILVNGRFIVSITLKGESDDS